MHRTLLSSANSSITLQCIHVNTNVVRLEEQLRDKRVSLKCQHQHHWQHCQPIAAAVSLTPLTTAVATVTVTLVETAVLLASLTTAVATAIATVTVTLAATAAAAVPIAALCNLKEAVC